MAEEKRTYVNHRDHAHPQTKEDRQRCLRSIRATGKPWDGVSEVPPREPKRHKSARRIAAGKKAAATRAKNQAAREKAEGVDSLLDASDRPAPLDGRSAPDFAPEVQGENALTGWRKAAGLSADSEPDAVRDEYGRFTKATLKKWDTLLTHLEGAQDYIKHNGIELTGAALTTTVGGQVFTAIFDGEEWTVEARTDNELFE